MTSRSRRSSFTLAAACCLVAGSLLAGCSGGSASDAPSTASAGAGSSDRVAAGVPAKDQAFDATRAAADGGSEVEHQAEISHGDVSLRSSDVAAARSEVRRLAHRQHGKVPSDSTESDEHGRAVSAHLVLRVPTSRFSGAMEALRGVGELAWAGSDTRDVTTRVIDTRVRLHAQRRSVHRVETLLSRAQDLRDIVLIESELSKRQAALDSLEQQSQYLADQTSMATITVDIARAHHATPTRHEDHTGFLAGLSAGWHGLTTVTVAAATALGAVLPFAVVLALLAALAWPALRVARRRHRPATPSTPAG